MEKANISKFKLSLTNTYNRHKEDAIVTLREFCGCYDVVDVAGTYRACELLESEVFIYHFSESPEFQTEGFFVIETSDGAPLYFFKGDTLDKVGEEMDSGIHSIWSVDCELLSVNEEA